MKGFLWGSLLALLTACQSEEQSGGENIGVSIADTRSIAYFQDLFQAFKRFGEAQPSLVLQLDSADGSQDKQNRQLDHMIQQGARALVVNLADIQSGGAFVTRYCRQLPLVFIDHHPGTRPLVDCPQAYMVEGDNVQAGIQQGLMVLQAWHRHREWDRNGDGIIQYAMMEGTPKHKGAIARTEWSVHTIHSYPGSGLPVERIFQETAYFQQDKAEDLMRRWLEDDRFQRLELILANNDSMALGAMKVLEERQQLRPIFGVDGSREALLAIQSGKMAGTVFNDYITQSRTASQMALNLAQGRPVMENIPFAVHHQTVRIPYLQITPANVRQFLNP